MTAGMAVALPQPAETALTAVPVLATAVWVGGLVAIFVVARVARATLGTAERVAFFRGLGRAYALAGGAALAIALGSGAVLAATYRWDGQLTASAVVAAGRAERRRPARGDRRAQLGAACLGTVIAT